MKTPVRPPRDFQALEERRKQAAKLFRSGEILASIARVLHVSRQSVSRWYRQWRQGGIGALHGAGRAGRKPKLDRQQLQRVDRALRQGARAHGFGTDLWTLPRVAAVIERLTGVRYHPGHVWKILGAMDWTLQRPARQARERNEEAVRQWVSERWPVVKKTLGAARPGASSRTRAASRSGPRSRTWAPRGQTPVLIHAFNWEKISVAAALAYRWDGKRCRLYFQIRPGSYGAESLIAFLKELRHHFRGQRVILVWDGLPAHKSRIMKEYLDPAPLAERGTAAGLRAGSQPGRDAVGQHQGPTTGESLLGRPGRGGHGSVPGDGAGASIPTTLFCFPPPCRSFFLT